MKEYCKWQKDIFNITEKKGYTFVSVEGTKVHPIFYNFKKTKQIGDNRFREYRLEINVNNHEPNSNWFSADYRLELKEYSNNDKGFINNYWGETPWVTAKSFFYKERSDYENLIEDIKFHHSY